MISGSLFTGIFGLDLGLERAGIECKWAVEYASPQCRLIHKHRPKVDLYQIAIQEFLSGLENGNISPESVDLISGGDPCGLPFTGIEISSEYFTTAVSRIEAEIIGTMQFNVNYGNT